MASRKTASRALIAAALVTTLAACSDDSPDDTDPTDAAHDDVAWDFTTRPDLTPPKIDLTTTEAGEQAMESGTPSLHDQVFLGVKEEDEGAPMNGPVIVDAEGDPVWVDPLGETRWAYDVRVQKYRGNPVLTWWRGDTSAQGHGAGEFVLMDQSYREIATVTTPGLGADFHDSRITPQGTILLMSYPEVPHDLSDLGGPEDGYLMDAVVHEIDIATGKTVFEWSALDHIPLSDSEQALSPDEEENGTEEAPYDPYHVNSVNEDGKNALLISARNTHAVYRVERKTGKVDWILGGKSSDFELPDDAKFAWQHDAERQADGTITLFDNESSPPIGDESRGLRLKLDRAAGTASVAAEYLPPDGRRADNQGNVEVLDDGSVFVGWGRMPFYSHYSADGELLQDAELAGGISYRAFRDRWVGHPVEPPKFVLEGGRAYVSWNGATEVDSWRFLAGPDKRRAEPVETVPVEGFETSAEMPDAGYIGAQALDESGKVLATATPGSWPVGDRADPTRPPKLSR